MAGLAQKNGAVMSFIRIADETGHLHAPRIGTAAADAVIGGDLVVTAGREALARYRRGQTRVVCNTAPTPTADFTRRADLKLPEDGLVAAIRDRAAADGVLMLDASQMAARLLGDAIAGNLMLLGAAWQNGLVPLSAEAIEQAITLNAVAVPMNLAAFRLGRRAAIDPRSLDGSTRPDRPVAPARRLSGTLDEAIARRVDFLTDYQDSRYAARYRDLVEAVRQAESADGRIGTAGVGNELAHWPLTEAVARNAFKLMAYKDEYEVARLYTDDVFLNRLGEQFEGNYQLRFHLAPPLLASRNAKGELQKKAYGPWMMKAFQVLARLRRLRGTPFDVFGYSAERREERQAIGDYRETVTTLLEQLARQASAGPAGESVIDRRERLSESLALAVEIASLPASVRGYGHVKARNAAAARQRAAELLPRFAAATARDGRVTA